MALKLKLKQKLTLTINPLLHSFIEFLPLNKLDFIDKIENESEANPMLEIENPAISAKREEDKNLFEERMKRADSSFVTTYQEEGFFKKPDDYIDKNRAIELFASSEITLSDHLLKQALSVFTSRELEIAKQIIYNLNKNGYLDIALESIASSINSTAEEIDKIRNIIRTFDPPGTGSRSLEECLLVQIDEDSNSKLKELISNHLEDLSKSKYEKIMKKLNISRDTLTGLIADLKKLNPKPSSKFEKEEIDYAEVDLLLIKEKDNYKVVYIDEGIPKLLLSHYYKQAFKETSDKKTASYLKERERNAQLFIEGIEMRKTIIVRIAEYLIKIQKDFLDFGEKWKKPLTMREVAQELSISESTVSRAVNNKFIATEKGVRNLRIFFASGLKGDFGIKHSTEIIKNKIKEIINSEAKKKPIADDDISKKLTGLGIKIARRTIRNYRTQMNIPNSSKRKEEYKLHGGKNEY